MSAMISVNPDNVETVLSDLPRRVRLAFGFGSRLRRGTLDVTLRSAALPPAILASIDQQRSRLAAIEFPKDIDAAARRGAEDAISQAFVAGFRAIMLVSAALALGAAASAWWLIREGAGKDDATQATQRQAKVSADPASHIAPRR